MSILLWNIALPGHIKSNSSSQKSQFAYGFRLHTLLRPEKFQSSLGSGTEMPCCGKPFLNTVRCSLTWRKLLQSAHHDSDSTSLLSRNGVSPHGRFGHD